MDENTEISSKLARLIQIYDLCDALTIPGAKLPPNAEILLADSLLHRDADAGPLCRAAVTILVSIPQIHQFLESAWTDDTETLDRFLANGTLIGFLNSALMQALLTSAIIPHMGFEKLLTHIRLRLLGSIAKPARQHSDNMLKASAALSIYAFQTEYVFAETGAETSLVNELLHSLESGSRSFDSLTLAVLGAYRPLYSLPLGKTLVAMGQWNPLVKDLIRIQFTEPEQERALAADIPALTKIDNAVSAKVRAQYEENPYPRWVSHIYNLSASPHDYFRMYCPGVDLGEYGGVARSEVLIAGCGTGRAAVEDGLLWREADILAMDLSLASLAYGKRRALELGLENISFAHGDILELSQSDKVFDYITCSGVLHHMADPIAGFRALMDVCRPGGVIRVSLYSEIAREPLRRVRQSIGPSRDGADSITIRTIRQELIRRIESGDNSDESVRHVFSIPDMYAMSTCRDLLFHLQEHDFTIPKIADVIDHLGLRFCGFVDSKRHLLDEYRAFAPQDTDCLDLDSWDRFEAANPQTFLGMYDFMVQKPLTAVGER